MAEIEPGRYRHSKGNEHTVLGVARHSETLEELLDRLPAGELSKNHLDGDSSAVHDRLSLHHIGIGLDEANVNGFLRY